MDTMEKRRQLYTRRHTQEKDTDEDKNTTKCQFAGHQPERGNLRNIFVDTSEVNN